MRFSNGLGVCLFLLVAESAFPQTSGPQPRFDTPPDLPEAISFFAPLFLPKIIQDEYRLKEFICSDEFRTFRKTYGDVNAVDAIFNRALTLSWNNVYEALSLSFVATMDHRNFGLRIPLLGPLVWVPLTSEFSGDFHGRVAALPAELYEDTPRGVAGDRDKLQHFFGSALLTYVTESPDAAQRVGLFMEWGEDRFVIDGVLDQRDIRANQQGQSFGTALLNDGTVLPSRFLKVMHQDLQGRGCVPSVQDTMIDPLVEVR